MDPYLELCEDLCIMSLACHQTDVADQCDLLDSLLCIFV